VSALHKKAHASYPVTASSSTNILCGAHFLEHRLAFDCLVLDGNSGSCLVQCPPRWAAEFRPVVSLVCKASAFRVSTPRTMSRRTILAYQEETTSECCSRVRLCRGRAYRPKQLSPAKPSPLCLSALIMGHLLSYHPGLQHGATPSKKTSPPPRSPLVSLDMKTMDSMHLWAFQIRFAGPRYCRIP